MTKNLESITSIYTNPIATSTLILNLKLLLNHWPWLLLSQIICLSIGFAYLRYSTPQYEITSTILVKDDTKGTDLGEAAILENLGLSGGKSNVDNEVEILKSRTLMETVVNDLQLYVTYFVSGSIKTSEVFDKSPVTLRFITLEIDRTSDLPKTYKLIFKDEDHFTLSDNIHTWNQAFGDTFLMPTGRATLIRTSSKQAPENSYAIKITGLEETVRKYRQQLSISATNKQVSIISLKIKDILPVRGELLLIKLTANYLHNSITDKNRIADSTISFIDQNLDLVSHELTNIEKQIEDFRKTNQVTDITEQSRILLDNSNMYDKEKLEAEVQLKIIHSLQIFLTKNPSGIIPSSIVLQSPDFTALVDHYNGIQLSLDKAGINATDKHPAVQGLNLQLKRIREEISGQIEAKQNELQISKNELDKNISSFKNEIRHIPARQRIFLDFARQQQIKQELYVFLLKKRVETSISKSSTLANGRIIDLAKADAIPVSPNRQLTFLLAILTGLAIPFAILNLREVFNTRVTDKQEIINQTGIPIIAEIGHKRVSGVNAFGQVSREHISEQFRSLRTNLQFLSSTHKNQVILITSGMGGEGKTFIAINICSALRLADKKVILVELDLRKPKIASYLHLEEKGLTEFLVLDKDKNIVVQNSGLTADFDVITAGSIPPNPAELLLSDKIQNLIFDLKKQYDYVILDSAPIGLVTDARLLSQYADISLYVIRQNFTFRHQLEDIKNISRDGLLPKLHLVVNDVKTTAGDGYNYGYGKK